MIFHNFLSFSEIHGQILTFPFEFPLKNFLMTFFLVIDLFLHILTCFATIFYVFLQKSAENVKNHGKSQNSRQTAKFTVSVISVNS